MMRTALIPSLSGLRAILVASTGGHLAQLHRLAPRLDLAPRPLWVTFDSEQSRSLLAGERVAHLPYIAPRDIRTLFRSGLMASRILRDEPFDVAISTGAAAALAVLPASVMRGRRSVYIESVSRFEGPSLTGRLISILPRVELYAQHAGWVRGRWRHEFSVLDDFVPEMGSRETPAKLRIFVTLGTIKPYRFDRLVDRLVEIAGDADIVWQLGETFRADLPGDVRTYMSAEEFDAEVSRADVVVTHAGVGTALKLLEMGIFPVLVPRRSSAREHVDDHQLQIAGNLQARGLARSPEVSELTMEDLTFAARQRVLRGAT